MNTTVTNLLLVLQAVTNISKRQKTIAISQRSAKIESEHLFQGNKRAFNRCLSLCLKHCANLSLGSVRQCKTMKQRPNQETKGKSVHHCKKMMRYFCRNPSKILTFDLPTWSTHITEKEAQEVVLLIHTSRSQVASKNLTISQCR